VAAGDYGEYTGNPAGFIRALIGEGESATSGLAIYREAGGAIQDSRWFQMYGQVANTVAQTPEMLGVDPFNLPGPGDYGEWATSRPGMYATQVEMQVLDRDLGQWLTMPYTYITDEPHTTAEAEQAAMDQFDPANTGSDFNQAMMGAVAVHLWRTVPLEG
jgi:hypothetical protein